MCGITGIFKYNNSSSLSPIELMTNSLSHRGPDATGFLKSSAIDLGHKRLAIIDLDACSNQPMTDHSKRYHIVFNGEIYNFRELRKMLPQYPFFTSGDTETALAAFSEWGPSAVKHLEGMFAFAIWDTIAEELFIVRDRLGVKPLYYCELDDVFIFASEVRSILASGMVPAKVNYESVLEFLQFQSVSQPGTIIDNVYSLDPGTYKIVKKGKVRTDRYWDITQTDRKFDYSSEKIIQNNIRNLLSESVALRMVSDVPVGAFLSGGIDSSIVVGLMSQISKSPVNTFTVGFDDVQYDESRYAEIISRKFNTKHQTITLKPEVFLDALLPALDAMDSPTGDGINSYIVSKAVRNTGITVALSGVGGDELFAGYPFFHYYLKIRKFNSIWAISHPLRKLVSSLANSNKKGNHAFRIKSILNASSPNISSLYPSFRRIIAPEMLRKLTTLPDKSTSFVARKLFENAGVEKLPLLSQVSVAEYLGYTSNTLLNDMDQMSMAVSLEVREPFFDHNLIEYVLHIPDEYKLGDYPKKLLVDSLVDMLPREIVNRKKQGFVIPWDKWMRNELKSFCEQHIQSISNRDFIKANGLLKYWQKFINNDPSVRWMEIWLFVVLEYWLNKNNVE